MKPTLFVRSKNDSYMVKREINDTKTEKFWHSYCHYRLLLWAWMLGDSAVVWAACELSHTGYYNHSIVYAISIVIVGTPLVLSEICVAQYTNCDQISMWNFFPLFRCIGYGCVYLNVLKTVYMLVLSTWYLEYSAHAALSPPPWDTCDDYTAKGELCMVKRINISIFQNCIEAQIMYAGDCGMKTASRCFFEFEIGNHVSSSWPDCLPGWKQTMALWSIGILLFVLSLKRKFLRAGVQCGLIYVNLCTLSLVCVALSTTGTWYSSSIGFGWANFDTTTVLQSLTKAFLSTGAGTGVLGFLSRGAPMRSPANMTALATPLLSAFTTLMLSLVTFSGIKTVSYYHGDEENVIEIGTNYFFTPFASMSEIMSYFYDVSIWGFIWFSANFVCMFVNTWLLFTYLKEQLVSSCSVARRHPKTITASVAMVLVLLSYPFFCSDLTPAVMDAVDTTQIFSSLIFSISIYWIYGYYNHSVDIMFMIGVKSSIFWKFCWLINPLLILCIFVFNCESLDMNEYDNSLLIEQFGINADHLVYFILVGIYVFIIIAALAATVVRHAVNGHFRRLFVPTEDWGPKDEILFKSRKMFVPEIMTREFLYRQVKIHGYSKKRTSIKAMRESVAESETDHYGHSTEWSVLTSN